MVENKYNRAFLSLTENCVHNITPVHYFSCGCARLEHNLSSGSLPQKRGKKRFFEVSLYGWIYAKYNKTQAQHLKHKITHTIEVLAQTLAQFWPLPLGVLTYRGPFHPGQFGCGFPGFGAGTVWGGLGAIGGPWLAWCVGMAVAACGSKVRQHLRPRDRASLRGRLLHDPIRSLYAFKCVLCTASLFTILDWWRFPFDLLGPDNSLLNS